MKKKSIIVWVILITVGIFFALVVTSGLTYFFAVKLPKMMEKEEQQKKYQEFYASELVRYENENKEYDDFEVDVAFLGDSLTAGYDIESYYPEYLVINRGIGGDTSHGLYDRLGVSVLDLKPKVAVMLIGGNNPDTMFRDYEDILISFKENIPDTKIILVSHAPASGSWNDKNKTFTYNNVKVKLLAEKYGYEFVDIYSPMFDLQTGKIKDEYTTDGAHFTAAGYEVVTEQIKPVIEKLLK